MKHDFPQSIQRRLTQHSKRPDYQSDPFTLASRMNTANTIHLQPNANDDMKRMVQSLEKSLAEERQRRQQLEQKLANHLVRSSQREQEFYTIIRNLSPVIFQQSSPQSIVQKLHSQVLDKFEQSDQKLRQKYEHCYKQNMTIMQRKVNELVQKMETEIKKTYKLSEDEHVQLRTLISRLEGTAMEVDVENARLSKRVGELEFRLRLLNEEKTLLIAEVNEKKSQVKRYAQQARRGLKQASQEKYNQRKSLEHSKLQPQHNKSSKETLQSKNSTINVGSAKQTSLNSLNTLNSNTLLLSTKHNTTFAYELMREKIFSNEIGGGDKAQLARQKKQTTNNKTKSNNQSHSGSQNKEYALVTISPSKDKRMSATRSSRGQSTFFSNANSKNSTIVMREPIFNDNEKQYQPQPQHAAQFNTINSLRNVASRQRQRKLLYHTQLSLLQQKIIIIDKIIIDALITLKEQQDNELMEAKYFSLNNNSRRNQDERQFMKIICDRVKNVISGNSTSSGGSHQMGMATKRGEEKEVRRNGRNSELLGLLNDFQGLQKMV